MRPIKLIRFEFCARNLYQRLNSSKKKMAVQDLRATHKLLNSYPCLSGTIRHLFRPVAPRFFFQYNRTIQPKYETNSRSNDNGSADSKHSMRRRQRLAAVARAGT